MRVQIVVLTVISILFEQYNQCLEACRSAANKLFEFFRLSMERKLSKVFFSCLYS